MDDHESHGSLPNVSTHTNSSSPEKTCNFKNNPHNTNITNNTTTTTSNTNNNEVSNTQHNKEQDKFLPIANVGRIMKKVIPGNGKISKEAKETVQECVSEFISFVTGEASDKCQREKRKTINGDDVIWSITTLGFEEYVAPLKIYLNKYRQIEEEKLNNVPKQQHRTGPDPRVQTHDQTQQDHVGQMSMGGFSSLYASSSSSSLTNFMPHHHQSSFNGGGGTDQSFMMQFSAQGPKQLQQQDQIDYEGKQW